MVAPGEAEHRFANDLFSRRGVRDFAHLAACRVDVHADAAYARFFGDIPAQCHARPPGLMHHASRVRDQDVHRVGELVGKSKAIDALIVSDRPGGNATTERVSLAQRLEACQKGNSVGDCEINHSDGQFHANRGGR